MRNGSGGNSLYILSRLEPNKAYYRLDVEYALGVQQGFGVHNISNDIEFLIKNSFIKKVHNSNTDWKQYIIRTEKIKLK